MTSFTQYHPTAVQKLTLLKDLESFQAFFSWHLFVSSRHVRVRNVSQPFHFLLPPLFFPLLQTELHTSSVIAIIWQSHIMGDKSPVFSGDSYISFLEFSDQNCYSLTFHGSNSVCTEASAYHGKGLVRTQTELSQFALPGELV